MNLDKNPHGKWQCPWHFCDHCGKLAKSMCALCPNSYCKAHETGEMFPLREDILLCSDHSETEFNTFLADLKKKAEIAGDSSSTPSTPPSTPLTIDDEDMATELKRVVDPGNNAESKSNSVVVENTVLVKNEVKSNDTKKKPKAKEKKALKEKVNKHEDEDDVANNGKKRISTTKKIERGKKSTKSNEKSKAATTKVLKPKNTQISKGKERKETVKKNKKLASDVVKDKKPPKKLT